MSTAQTLIRQLHDSVGTQSLVKVVFSSPRDRTQAIVRVDVRPIELRGGILLQFTSASKTQTFHKNLEGQAAAKELSRLATEDFHNVRLTTTAGTTEARCSIQGKWSLRIERPPAQTASANSEEQEAAGESKIRKPLETSTLSPVIASHNRARNYLIPEGIPCPFLIHTGIMNKDGHVRASHARKFRQINRYLEFIHDVAEYFPGDRPVRVVDFGCGKSYLTFATHYLLTSILKRDCQIIGLDQRSDVINTCAGIVDQLKLENLTFQVGDIAGYSTERPVDMVISLHACDTATDHALLQAVRWKSRVILAVPCCQHELNAMLTAESLPPVTSFGLTKERFAAIATDTLRANLLTAAGYQTQVLEFIETEHTPKNLLIRAVRRFAVKTLEKNDSAECQEHPAGAVTARPAEENLRPQASKKALFEVRNLRETLRVGPLTLESGLMESGEI